MYNSTLFSDEMHVFHVGKRSPPYQHWEPIYIGTHQDPLYDERLSWEGRSDKMTQASIANAFLLINLMTVFHALGLPTMRYGLRFSHSQQRFFDPSTRHQNCQILQFAY